MRTRSWGSSVGLDNSMVSPAALTHAAKLRFQWGRCCSLPRAMLSSQRARSGSYRQHRARALRSLLSVVTQCLFTSYLAQVDGCPCCAGLHGCLQCSCRKICCVKLCSLLAALSASLLFSCPFVLAFVYGEAMSVLLGTALTSSPTAFSYFVL